MHVSTCFWGRQLTSPRPTVVGCVLFYPTAMFITFNSLKMALFLWICGQCRIFFCQRKQSFAVIILQYILQVYLEFSQLYANWKQQSLWYEWTWINPAVQPPVAHKLLSRPVSPTHPQESSSVLGTRWDACQLGYICAVLWFCLVSRGFMCTCFY